MSMKKINFKEREREKLLEKAACLEMTTIV